MLIRPAIESDLALILEIYNHAIIHTTAVYDYKPHTLEMRKKWLQEKQEKRYPVLVADVETQIAGFASYGPFRPWAAYKYSVEHSVYVHPSYRRQGIARSLMKSLIQVAQVNHVHTMIAGIDALNSISIQLHKDLGFKDAGCLKQVGFKFGQWLDLQFYQLTFQTPDNPEES